MKTLTLSLFVALAVVPASGQTTYTWTGADPDDNLWSTPGNWSPAGVPGSGDAVVISGGSVDVESDVTVGSLSLGGAFSLQSRVQGSADVTVQGTLTWEEGGGFDGSGTVTVQGGTVIDPAGATTASDALYVRGRTVRLGNVASVVVPTSGGRMDIYGGVVEVDGPLAVSGPGTLSVQGSATTDALGLDTEGELRLAGAGGLSVTGGGLTVSAALTNSNNGPLTAANGTLTVVSSVRTGSDAWSTSEISAAAGATIEAQGDSLTVTGPITANGTVILSRTFVNGQIVGDGQLRISDQVTLSTSTVEPTLVFGRDSNSRGSLTLTAPLTLDQDLDLWSGGFSSSDRAELIVEAPLTIAGDLVLGPGNGRSFGTLSGTADVTVRDSLIWRGGGNFDGSGTVTVQGGSRLEAVPRFGSSGGDMTVVGRTIRLGEGTVEFPSGASQLNIRQGAVVEIEGPFTASGPSDGTFTVPSYGNGENELRITGAGGVVLNGGMLVLNAAVENANDGAIVATAGNLQLRGASGSFATSALTAEAGAEVTLAGNGAVTGPLTSNGLVIIQGIYSIDGPVLGEGEVRIAGNVTTGATSFEPTLFLGDLNNGNGSITLDEPLTLDQDLEIGSSTFSSSEASLIANAPITITGDVQLGTLGSSRGRGRIGGTADVTIEGKLRWVGGGRIDVEGTVVVEGESSLEPQVGGTSQGESHLRVNNSTVILSTVSTVNLSGSSLFYIQNNGNVILDGPLVIDAPAANGILEVIGANALSIEGPDQIQVKRGALGALGFVNTGASTIDEEGRLSIGSNRGTIGGTGRIDGTFLAENVGAIVPGGRGEAGELQLDVRSNQSLDSRGVVEVDLGGTTPGTGHDQLNVAGSIGISGELAVRLIDGFTPTLGQSFIVMTFVSHTGEFDVYTGIALPGGLELEPTYTETALVLTVVEGSGGTGLQPGNCSAGSAQAVLAANDVRARLYTTGSLFNPESGDTAGGYLAPASASFSPLFAMNLWVGGTVSGDVRSATGTVGATEFWPGPLGADGRPVDPSDCSPYDRIWSVSRSDVSVYETFGTASADLTDWPVGLGAPSVDAAGTPIVPTSASQTLDLAAGERPAVLGDRTAFWVMNDVGNVHAGTETPPIGLEVRVTAFAVASGDPALNRSTFYRYELVNKSDAPLDNTHLGLYVDPDIGNPLDDYVGSDPSRSLGFAYNATPDDQNGILASPLPALGVDLLGGAGAVMTFNRNDGRDATNIPRQADAVYSFLRGRWGDGTPLTTGGDGYATGGAVTTFAYPGAPEAEAYWSQVNVDGAGTDAPDVGNENGDRLFLISTEAFTLAPGESTTVDAAVLFAQGDDHLASVAALRAVSDQIQGLYAAGRLYTADPTTTAYTWTGAGGDASWTTAGNWNPVGVPQPGDPITIGGAVDAVPAGLGSLRLTPNSVLNVGLAPEAGASDQISVTGSAVLGGTLAVQLADGFTPAFGQELVVLRASSIEGTFAAITGTDLGGGRVLEPIYTATSVALVLPGGVTVDVGGENGAGANGADAPVTVSVGGITPTSGTLYYRPSGGGAFTSVALTADGSGAFGATIPAQAVTLRGVDYYATLTDGTDTVTFPAVRPEAEPARLRVTASQVQAPVSFPAEAAYRMVSLPVAVPEATPSALFADDYGPYNPSTWRLFRWDAAAGQNMEVEAGSPLARGAGFWLIASAPFDVDGALSANASAPVAVTLQPGWNQIGTPFGFPVAWADVLGTASVSPPAAWDDAEYLLAQTTLDPWAGYFVENLTDAAVTITVPPVAADAARLATTDAPDGYRLRLAAHAGDLRDTQNVLGFADGAEAGRDALDLAEPPPPGDHVRLSFVDDAQGGVRLAHSLRPDDGAGAAWDAEVAASPGALRDGPLDVRVALADEGPLPDGYVRHVLDLDRGVAVGSDVFSVTLAEAAPTRRLRVVVGTEAFARSAAEGVDLTPPAFALDPPAPNPSHGDVSVRWSIAEASGVSLAVYDLLGRRVAVLAEGDREAGRYRETLSASGPGALASGVYVVRLTAGERVATQKLVVLR